MAVVFEAKIFKNSAPLQSAGGTKGSEEGTFFCKKIRDEMQIG